MTEKRSGIMDFVSKIRPEARPGLGAAAALGLYAALGIPAAKGLMHLIHKDVEVAHNAKPEKIDADRNGPELIKWVRRFKAEHPETASVPVYVSGKVPVSMYIPDLAFKVESSRQHLKDNLDITEPGVYLKEVSAPIALHELGHASLETKVPKIRVLTQGLSAMALPLLAWTLFKKPLPNPGLIESWAPAISAALQIPLLAEEAAASIMAHRTLKRDGESGLNQLFPAWLTYAISTGALPTAQAVATLLKKRI